MDLYASSRAPLIKNIYRAAPSNWYSQTLGSVLLMASIIPSPANWDALRIKAISRGLLILLRPSIMGVKSLTSLWRLRSFNNWENRLSRLIRPSHGSLAMEAFATSNSYRLCPCPSAGVNIVYIMVDRFKSGGKFSNISPVDFTKSTPTNFLINRLSSAFNILPSLRSNRSFFGGIYRVTFLFRPSRRI